MTSYRLTRAIAIGLLIPMVAGLVYVLSSGALVPVGNLI